MPTEAIDHENTDLPVCPWCGYEHHDYFEFATTIQGDYYNCDRCGKPFELDAETTILFTTRRTDEAS
jgi:DNA-directed RNA polymerase subunit RPC12/RpoP